ncbi:hypothetical protein FRC01_014788 [Tulasnella sp. 417]|nr:hypothetical protein FRC01_014788 [Tulasnella sp. 417]
MSPGAKKSAKKEFRATLASVKTYADLSEFIGGIEGGEEVLKEVEQVLIAREQAKDVSRLLEVVQTDAAHVEEQPPSLSARISHAAGH